MGDLNYVQYNFEELVQQLSDRVKASDTWRDTYRSGTGQMIIELYAYVGNLVLYYLERVAQEGFIETARNRSSIINLTRLLGYTPKRAISATGSVTFTLAAPRSTIVLIPGYNSGAPTMLTTESGTPFLVLDDVSISAGQTTVGSPVEIIQGVKVDKTITSTGAINQEYNINATDIENTHLKVYIDGVEWTAVSSFISGTPSSQWYKVRGELNGTITILFGDNITAKSPSAGSTIVVRYIRTQGESGNVYVTGLINTIQSVIYDTASAVVQDISVSNAGAVLGGSAEESTEEIRSEAPKVFATGDRLVTREDYIAVLENYDGAGVETANVWGENEEIGPPDESVYDMFNRVKISMVLSDWGIPSESATLLDTLTTFLRTKSIITVKYTFVDPDIIEIIPIVDLTVTSGYRLQTVSDSVVAALESGFVLGTTTKLGTAKRLSDLMAVVEGVDGISYHHLELDIYRDIIRGYTSMHEFGETLPIVPILPESVDVYVSTSGAAGSIVAVDDGASGFTAASSTYAVAGSIDYDTGELDLDFTPALGLSDAVYVRYRTDTRGDLVAGNNQIFKLKEVEIATLTYGA